MQGLVPTSYLKAAADGAEPTASPTQGCCPEQGGAAAKQGRDGGSLFGRLVGSKPASTAAPPPPTSPRPTTHVMYGSHAYHAQTGGQVSLEAGEAVETCVSEVRPPLSLPLAFTVSFSLSAPAAGVGGLDPRPHARRGERAGPLHLPVRGAACDAGRFEPGHGDPTLRCDDGHPGGRGLGAETGRPKPRPGHRPLPRWRQRRGGARRRRRGAGAGVGARRAGLCVRTGRRGRSSRRVRTQRANGWTLVRSLSSGREGLAPSSFLDPPPPAPVRTDSKKATKGVASSHRGNPGAGKQAPSKAEPAGEGAAGAAGQGRAAAAAADTSPKARRSGAARSPLLV